MRLYEIDAAILDCIDEETGEILDVGKLTKLSIERESKIEGVALWVKNLKSDVEALKAERDTFAERAKQASKKLESLSEWLRTSLNGQRFDTSLVSVSSRKSEAVGITDINVIPDEYVTETITETPDKREIKIALKSGEKVPGCDLVLKDNIQIK